MLTTSSAIRILAVSSSWAVRFAAKMFLTLATSTPPVSRHSRLMTKKIVMNMPLMRATPSSPSCTSARE